MRNWGFYNDNLSILNLKKFNKNVFFILENSNDETTNTRQNLPLVNTDGLSITKRILPGIANVTNNQTNTITDDGMGKTPNGGINNGKYVRYSYVFFFVDRKSEEINEDEPHNEVEIEFLLFEGVFIQNIKE